MSRHSSATYIWHSNNLDYLMLEFEPLSLFECSPIKSLIIDCEYNLVLIYHCLNCDYAINLFSVY